MTDIENPQPPSPPPAAGCGPGTADTPQEPAAVPTHPLKGRPRSAETKARIAAAMTGRTLSAETRAKLSAIASAQARPIANWSDPEFRARHSARSSAMMTANWQDEDFRRRASVRASENNRRRGKHEPTAPEATGA